MAGQKWHSAEDIARNLRRAGEVAAEGKQASRSPLSLAYPHRFPAT
ncbi:hypothetical protein [Nocardia sp. NPDC058633]